MKTKNIYNESFYNEMKKNTDQATNKSSAELIVPYILQLFPNTQSVVDFGGAIGIWARAFLDCGIEDVHVIDGNWVNKEKLEIPETCFETFDFSKQTYKPIRKYDIAMSLEVAEHISAEKADLFVKSLVDSSDVIIFSAAIPAQGGTGHINEQPQSYWKKKFEKYGYKAIDPIRGEFQNDFKVQTHYRQNMIVYVKNIDNYTEIKRFANSNFVADFVCPEYAYLLHETNTWKHLFSVQWVLIKKMVEKLFHLKQ